MTDRKKRRTDARGTLKYVGTYKVDEGVLLGDLPEDVAEDLRKDAKASKISVQELLVRFLTSAARSGYSQRELAGIEAREGRSTATVQDHQPGTSVVEAWKSEERYLIGECVVFGCPRVGDASKVLRIEFEGPVGKRSVIGVPLCSRHARIFSRSEGQKLEVVDQNRNDPGWAHPDAGAREGSKGEA
jgi:hypothetical protein